jgi:hypothetical protein
MKFESNFCFNIKHESEESQVGIYHFMVSSMESYEE